MAVVKEDSELCERYRNAALQLAAPDHFYKRVADWKGGLDILTRTPLTPTCNPPRITRYLVHEADVEVMEEILDVMVLLETLAGLCRDKVLIAVTFDAILGVELIDVVISNQTLDLT